MPGFYKDVNGSSTCEPCVAGTFSGEAGRKVPCTDLCLENTYSNDGASQCTSCPDGSYSQDKGGLLYNCTCKAGYSPKLIEASQWISTVVDFSSQISNATAVIGPPDDDLSSSDLSASVLMAMVSSSAPDPTEVKWLELNITFPVVVAEVQIFERNAPGACTRIMLMDASGEWVTVWRGRAFQQAGSRVFAPPISTMTNKTSSLRLEFNVSNFTNMYQVRWSS